MVGKYNTSLFYFDNLHLFQMSLSVFRFATFYNFCLVDYLFMSFIYLPSGDFVFLVINLHWLFILIFIALVNFFATYCLPFTFGYVFHILEAMIF